MQIPNIKQPTQSHTVEQRITLPEKSSQYILKNIEPRLKQPL